MVEAIIRNIVGRCHVGDSYRKVLGYVIHRMKGRRKSWRKLPRATRRKIMELVKKEHQANRDLYRWVMGGGHGYRGKRPRKP